jgi:L-ascorbate metabolism protein UlaG (beta-lactamase superfamily)
MTLSRQDCAALVVGGPTTVLDLGGLRIVTDPTFDPPGPHGYLTKTAGPAVTEDQLGRVDLVLVSHDNHADNLDDAGRALALAAPLLLTTTSGSGRLGLPAMGLPPWTRHSVARPDGGELTVTAVPAVHGPEDAERDPDGFVNCEVIGFVLAGAGLPTVYVSGDNASIRTVVEVAQRVPSIDAVVLHAGAARVQGKFRGRALSLDSVRAAAAAAILDAAVIVPAHYDGWAHFSEGRDDLARAFDDAGLSARLRLSDHGTWIPLRLSHNDTNGPSARFFQRKPADAAARGRLGAWRQRRRCGNHVVRCASLRQQRRWAAHRRWVRREQ